MDHLHTYSLSDHAISQVIYLLPQRIVQSRKPAPLRYPLLYHPTYHQNKIVNPQLRKSTAKFAVAQLLCYVFREQNHGLIQAKLTAAASKFGMFLPILVGKHGRFWDWGLIIDRWNT